MASSRTRRRLWIPAAVVAGLLLAAALVPLSVQRERTYCRLCGSLRETVVRPALLWTYRRERKVPIHFVRPMGAAPCEHDFVVPGGRPEHLWSGLPGVQLARNNAILARYWILNALGEGAFPGVLPRLRSLPPDRRAAVWRAWLDPDSLLPAVALGVFDTDTSSESRFALWQRLRSLYSCAKTNEAVFCVLDGPGRRPILAVRDGRLRQARRDWGYWNPGASPPPFLFGVDETAPADAAEAARARALLLRALSFLRIDPGHAPQGADFTYHKQTLGDAGGLARESVLVDGRFGARFHHESDEGAWGFVFSKKSGRITALPEGETLPPEFFHQWWKSLFAYTPAVHLARATGDDVKLRHLGQVEIDGRRLEQLLVCIFDTYLTLFFIDPADGSVAGERRWSYTGEGQEMQTTWFSDWRLVDGIRVPFAERTEQGGPVPFDGRSARLRFDPWPLTGLVRATRMDWQGQDGLLNLFGVWAEDRRRDARRSRIESWRWNPAVTAGDFTPPGRGP